MNKPGNYVLAVIILLSWTLSAMVRAQEIATPAVQRVVLHAGKLLDVRSGKTLSDQTIVIEAGKIVSVGSAGQANRSSGDRFIDLPNATVLPGLTDAHTHLTGDPQDVGPQALSISIPRATLTGARNARLTLEAGFTTVRNVGAEGFGDVALRDAINAGDVPGPHMLVSGPALGITGGHCDENLLPFEYHYSAEGVADGVFTCPDPAASVARVSALLDGLSVATLVYRSVTRAQLREWVAAAVARELGLEAESLL